ncbi:type VII toxin-antitoxin system MntA family adenylyltransferase antitoxin [Marinimicrobium locisalis]|uniref:type VII toxin-antitoxin system MntA family adenylyltransferase antitoxin n=1 Tax=Marinimicrobium locisalis TaxID=546022 RepID=UPI0032216C0B
MAHSETVTRLREALSRWPELQVAVLFGSLAHGQGHRDSDLDVAVQLSQPLSSDQKMALIDHLAGVFGRPIDVIDLREVGQPLLNEIVSKGVMVKGGAAEKGDLLFKSIMMQEDFGHYQQRILEGRRNRWIER